MSEENDLLPYRAFLVSAEKDAQADYDKTVIALSGGGIGISFAFIDKIVGEGPIVEPGLLILAWAAWGLSAAAILLSFWASGRALRKAREQVDLAIKTGDAEAIRGVPGGYLSRVTDGLNAAGGLLFLVGLAFIACFANLNLE